MGTTRVSTGGGKVRPSKPREIRQGFPAGTRIFGPDHGAQRVYQLISGHVQLRNGPEVIVDQLAPGDFFGEKCLLPSGRNDQVAIALSAVIVLAYRKSQLLRGLQRDPHAAGRLLKNLTRRLDRYENAIRDFVTEPAERRLARLLLRLMPARPVSGWIRLPLRVTNGDLGRMAGLTRWRVSHFLNRFRRLGWLTRGPEGLRINREGLKDFLDSPARQ